MTKSRSSAQAEKSQVDVEIELRPDGWERFERAVDAALKTPPKPRRVKGTTAKTPSLE